MEQEFSTLLAEGQILLDAAVSQIVNLTLPSRLYQIGILILCCLAAWLVRRRAGNAFRNWLRAREGWPKWRLRLGIVLEKRLGLIIFAVLAWTSTAVV